MARENLVFNSLRLNMNNPQHVKINEILCSIDKDVCKSKNQFIIDAIEFYIDNFGKQVLVKEETDTQYVTTDELEDIKKELMEAAMTEARSWFSSTSSILYSRIILSECRVVSF